VLDLKRVAFGGIELNNLPENKTRFFTRREYDDLHKFLKAKKQADHAQKKSDENHQMQLEKSKKEAGSAHQSTKKSEKQ
jgi:23S rRNA pseudouridine2605 synthase